MIDLDKLEELAKAATPGPWTWWTSNSYRRLSARGDGDVLHAARLCDGVYTIDGKEANKDFIAAANPAAILELIETQRMLVEALFDVIGWVPGRQAWHTDAPIKAVEMARQAIKKATGE